MFSMDGMNGRISMDQMWLESNWIGTVFFFSMSLFSAALYHEFTWFYMVLHGFTWFYMFLQS